jgi:muconate cycloisomerase
MRIVAIDAYPLILPVAEIYGGAAGTLEDCRSLIVRVETADGLEGWGEATQGRPGNTYETLETMEIMVRNYFAPALVGGDLEETGALLERLHQVRSGHPLAKAALETALYDALGKWYKVPLYRLLGGPYRTTIELVGGLGLDLGPESIRERAGRLKRDGFHAFKIKIGGKERTRDVARVAAVRQAAGDDATIRVDGNAAYSFTEAREILTELSRFRISDAEQPLARGDLKSLAELRRAVVVPIAAQESITCAEDALSVLEANAADLVKIKLTHIGGFQRAAQIAHIFGAKRLPVVVGQGSACTTILSLAEMHLHASLPNAQPGGEMTGFLRLGEQDVFSRVEIRDGKVSLPTRPGLGVDVSKDNLGKQVRRSHNEPQRRFSLQGRKARP